MTGNGFWRQNKVRVSWRYPRRSQNGTRLLCVCTMVLSQRRLDEQLKRKTTDLNR